MRSVALLPLVAIFAVAGCAFPQDDDEPLGALTSPTTTPRPTAAPTTAPTVAPTVAPTPTPASPPSTTPAATTEQPTTTAPPTTSAPTTIPSAPPSGAPAPTTTAPPPPTTTSEDETGGSALVPAFFVFDVSVPDPCPDPAGGAATAGDVTIRWEVIGTESVAIAVGSPDDVVEADLAPFGEMAVPRSCPDPTTYYVIAENPEGVTVMEATR